jgi:hypothetical protein
MEYNMPSIMESIKKRNAAIEDAAKYIDPSYVPPASNVTGTPPAKAVANAALNQAQSSADNALKKMIE